MTESCRLITTEQYQEYLKLKEEDNHWHNEAERISHEAIGARLEAITLKKKLAIAVESLNQYAQKLNWANYGEDFANIPKENSVYMTNGFKTARQALKEIEEVE